MCRLKRRPIDVKLFYSVLIVSGRVNELRILTVCCATSDTTPEIILSADDSSRS
jgi:hypothetical protein